MFYSRIRYPLQICTFSDRLVCSIPKLGIHLQDCGPLWLSCFWAESALLRSCHLSFHIFNFFSETAELNSTKLNMKQDLNILYQVCVFSGRSEKQDSCRNLWLADTFWTSPLKPLNWIQRNLRGSKISTSSTSFVFFGPLGETRWLPWPLIGWGILDFSSETAEAK